MTAKQREDAFYALCKAKGWKCTIQRRAVFNFIAENMKHPSVEEVCAAVRKTVPNISTDSVYRILNDFAAAGVLLRLEGCGKSHFDPNTAEHDHFYCLRCGHVYDLSGEGRSVPKDRYAAFGEVQFCEVRVTGTCRNCLENPKIKAKRIQSL
ncbi:MAG: Transcriptional regulator PerR [Lentisphaerae bacterium ADurb.Bin242]|nr:MAG: Transcriptional regulator PerR [Lentisphaerae bacterium ADurb.Bin242]